MSGSGNKIRISKDRLLGTVGAVLLFLLAFMLFLKSGINNYQATGAASVRVVFEGEYSIGGGKWQPITDGRHIPSTVGDVTLRGNFQLFTPDGVYYRPAESGLPIAFFLDHINVRILENGFEPYELYNENPSVGQDACGEIWLVYTLMSDGSEPLEMIVRNPHSFGNATAVDSLLEGFAVWYGADLENEVLSSGKTQRYIGLMFVICSLVLLGIALFSSLLHIQKSGMIGLYGFTALFAGGYLTYSASGSYFWSELIAVNTTVVGTSMMFYMLSVSAMIVSYLNKTKRFGTPVIGILCAADALLLLLPLFGVVYLYDTHAVWVLVQSMVNAALLGFMIFEAVGADKRLRFTYLGLSLLLVSFEVDALATAFGWWKGGLLSMYAFFILFGVTLFVVLRVIPINMLALREAKDNELRRSRLEAEKNAVEAELKESRISTMLSQIRPHFIYNTLGTIERLCLKDPQTAFELVRNFSLYLRGNFSELDSTAPIRFADEIRHVRCYVNIEKVRFPDITVEYRLETSDFFLPALSVQPLVENAIKHGLMRLESGGTVVIRSYETETDFVVEVSDNGVGFDTSIPINKKEHIGLHNIRERLQAISDGTLCVESTIGVGTKVTIMIPKENRP